MFENKMIKGVHASRYIMSWIREGGELHWRAGISEFNDWLKSLNLTDDEMEPIIEIAQNGKMELEVSAGRFLNKTKELNKDEEA